ncbi:MAG: 4Fe-4S dicluster domain-containing protein [Planctomycetota bacterium]|nr:4Fe-4S dicluster domain-containing protein [Planctomycetota bacterium]
MKDDITNTGSNSRPPLDQPTSALPLLTLGPAEISRRQFLEAAGFTISLAAVGGCYRPPEQHALPFTQQPPGAIPGRTRYYASTCSGCNAGCGMLIGTRDGRPLKMEGMPEHPLSAGGLCAVGQATPMGLYDSQRLNGPLSGGQPAEWTDIDQEINQQLQELKEQKKAVRLVTSTVTSPTLQATIDGFLAQFSDARHVVLDAVSSSAILDAHEKTHGARVLPRYVLDRAAVLVSFGADFLGTWISPVEFTAGWRTRRVPTEEHPVMSYHVQLESRMSLTGSNADRRIRIRPEDQGPLVAGLADKLAALAGDPPETPSAPAATAAIENQDAVLDDLANRLWKARGECLVLCDSQDVDVQVLVNYINHLLGNYAKTIDIQRPSRQRQGNDREVAQLIEELKAGQVGALLVAGTDLSHNLPDRTAFAAAVGNVPLVVSLAERENDFASLARFVCPDHHSLEAWLDAEPVSGLLSLAQPTLRPLNNTRSILESFALWSGRQATAYDMVREHWRDKIFPRNNKAKDFDAFWNQSLHDGFLEVEPETVSGQSFQMSAVKPLGPQSAPADYALVLYSNVALPDSRHAHNPWLQELPDPVTKVTWANYVSVSPAMAAQFGLTGGDVVRVEAGSGGPSLELPALVQPGQHDQVLGIALAYGVKGTDRFAGIGPQWLEARPTVPAGELVGKNAAGFLQLRDGTLRYVRNGVTLQKTGRRHELASTQEHHAIEIPAAVAPYGAEHREIVQQTTLAAFKKDHHAGAPEHHHFSDTQLWPEDHPKTGHHWGMVIDLNACSGCSACVIACQSENNVPVVGADEVRRQREMHWIRIDRYYSGAGDDVAAVHQPMMCQHCDNAPCETVCPVLATVHSEGGLNEQVYNRCVGTRYCANNCPYKVRRFNWFLYAREDPVQNLLLNPDVTVRTRGVMEKCSMCVQRIEQGKIDARSQGQPIRDGNVLTACQQSCPAQAIVFGDMNDPESQIHAALENPRRFQVLEELNVRPSVSYQRVVKNSVISDQ